MLPFNFAEDATDIGEVASIMCIVPKGDLPIRIQWFLNSQPIVNGEHDFSVVHLNRRTSSLNIESLGDIHRGSYKCLATNKAGSSEYTAELEVNGLCHCFFFFCTFSNGF